MKTTLAVALCAGPIFAEVAPAFTGIALAIYDPLSLKEVGSSR
jgi:hypothetical protein